MRGKFLMAILVLLCSSEGFSAGMSTHMMMTEKAIELVKTPELKNILSTYRDAVLSGSVFPDIGGGLRMVPGQYKQGQEMYLSHQPEFMEAYLALIKEICPPPFSECPELVAHFMGTVAHCVEDNVYDSLFLRRVYNTDLKNKSKSYDLDTTIDLAFIVKYDRFKFIPKYFTPVKEIQEVFARIGLNYSRSQIQAGAGMHKAGLLGQRIIAIPSYPFCKALTPWAIENIYSAPGGVEYNAKVIADLWEVLWKRLNGNEEETELLLGIYPPDGCSLPIQIGSVVAYFSSGIKKEQFNSSTFFITDQTGNKIECDIRFPGELLRKKDHTKEKKSTHFQRKTPETTYLVTLNPLSGFTPNATYSYFLSGSIKNLSGRSLGKDVKGSFKVEQ